MHCWFLSHAVALCQCRYPCTFISLQVNWQSKQWELSRVEVHKERYDGPYKGQMDLCGCGGGMPVSVGHGSAMLCGLEGA